MSKLKSVIHHIRVTYFKRIRHDLKLLLNTSPAANVNFLVCGTQKGGTTALDTYLRQHPEICMAKYKEVHYFDRENYFLYQKPDYRQYHAFFNPNQDHKVVGETTPVYMYWTTVPRRIWEYNPSMKLIIILRNPIERAYSHWNMQRDRGYDTLSFFDAIQSEEKRRQESLPWQNRRFSYLDRGFYTEQIRRLRSFFPEEQIMIMRNKQLRENPKKCLNQISQFIEVSSLNTVEPINRHTRHYASPMSAEERDLLKQIFKFEIRNLERLTGWDCQDWLEN